jgi:outer membrane protein assembly factor BamB
MSIHRAAKSGKRDQAPFVRNTGHQPQVGRAVPAKGTSPRLPREILLCLFASGVLFFSAGRTASGGENWPGFRGPTGMGYADETDLPVTWGGKDQENVLWKAPLVGQGHASPIVWKDRVFVCTARWPTEVANRQEVIPEHHVLCYAARDGRLLWDTLVPPGPWVRRDLRSGPGGGYAAATPTTDGELVYCAFGSAVVVALDFQGNIVWRKEIVPHPFDNTIGSSPVLYRDTLLMLCAVTKPADSKIIAYDKKSGAVRWQKGLVDTGFGHSTPLLIEVGGQTQMLFCASAYSGTAPNALQSVDPATGELIWWCYGSGDAASPVYAAGLVYFDSGRGGPGVAVDPSGKGEVSKTHTKWTIENMPKDMNSPVVFDGRLYRLSNQGVLRCYQLATGELLWAGRLDGISTTWASAVVDPNGRIYFANAGKSFVVQAGPEFKVLATNDLGDGSHPSPAVAAGRIFLVGQESVFCVGK